MPPLECQLSRTSIYSWWSDGNPMLSSGPTINIHAMAKPLMRRMYHRQALAYIAQDGHGKALSGETVEMYSSYLSFKYILPETRLRVLEHLTASAISQPDTAQEIWCSSVVALIPQMVEEGHLQTTFCSLVTALMAHSLNLYELSTEWIIERIEETWIGTEDERTVATAVAGAISEYMDDAGIIAKLFDSDIAFVRLWACTFVREMASFWFAAHSILGCVPLDILFKLVIQDPDEKVSAEALRTLDQLARHPDGAAAIVGTKMLDTIWDSAVHASAACTLVSTLISQQYSVYSLLQEDSIRKMLDFLRYESNITTTIKLRYEIDITRTIQLLSGVAENPPGPAAILATDWLRKLPDLLLSNSTYIKQRTCLLIHTLVQREPVRVAHLWENSIARMLIVLCDEDTDNVRSIFDHSSLTNDYGYQAMSALAEIARHAQGAQVLVAAQTNKHLPIFLRSKNVFIKIEAYNIVDNLAEQGLLAGTVFGRRIIRELAHIIRQEDDGAAFQAVSALRKIAGNADGVLNFGMSIDAVRQQARNLLSELGEPELSVDPGI
ncbi:hypothetical protein FB45DRAFT_122826 [Roridomyces roridus]|uniref:ARM repeat-containing protein n=1 Tax=Roridomyces roridus TaxID=1738132 RepID=A0AAD7BJ10_9AGAR|nr:hypothetical protein FB45DRAFT_122826 [Roridomyces roridus]